MEEEKRGRGNGGSENTGGFSYIWLFEQINHFADLHCPYSVLLNHFLRKHFNELSQKIFYWHKPCWKVKNFFFFFDSLENWVIAVLPWLPVKLLQLFWTLKQSLFLTSFNFRIYNNKSHNTFFSSKCTSWSWY